MLHITNKHFTRRKILQINKKRAKEGEMESFGRKVKSVRSDSVRRIAAQAINMGMIITSALMMWKLWICLSGSDSPAVVVLTGSMEPGFKRGDILFLQMNDSPVRSGEIVVFHIETDNNDGASVVQGKEIPIVHRVITVHERNTDEINVLTKGDNNVVDDRHGIYADGQLWLERNHIMGRVIGYFPYVGWLTIVMKEKPIIKYLLVGALSLLAITSKE